MSGSPKRSREKSRQVEGGRGRKIGENWAEKISVWQANVESSDSRAVDVRIGMGEDTHLLFIHHV